MHRLSFHAASLSLRNLFRLGCKLSFSLVRVLVQESIRSIAIELRNVYIGVRRNRWLGLQPDLFSTMRQKVYEHVLLLRLRSLLALLSLRKLINRCIFNLLVTWANCDCLCDLALANSHVDLVLRDVFFSRLPLLRRVSPLCRIFNRCCRIIREEVKLGLAAAHLLTLLQDRATVYHCLCRHVVLVVPTVWRGTVWTRKQIDRASRLPKIPVPRRPEEQLFWWGEVGDVKLVRCLLDFGSARAIRPIDTVAVFWLDLARSLRRRCLGWNFEIATACIEEFGLALKGEMVAGEYAWPESSWAILWIPYVNLSVLLLNSIQDMVFFRLHKDRILSLFAFRLHQVVTLGSCLLWERKVALALQKD